MKIAMQLIKKEKLLVAVAGFAFLLGVICGLYSVISGGVVLPEGNVKDAFSFNTAIALFVLSIAAILPLSEWSDKKRKKFRRSFAAVILFSCTIETVQHFRGIDPRYPRAGTVWDSVMGGVFGVVSLFLIVLIVRFAWTFFQEKEAAQRSILKLSICYAFLSVMLAFIAGILMIAFQTRYIGPAGSLIVVHGLGFHALQVLPLTGWLMERNNLRRRDNRFILHLSGVSWLIAISFLSLQTGLGRSVFAWEVLPLLGVGTLLIPLLIVGLSVFQLLMGEQLNSRQMPKP